MSFKSLFTLALALFFMLTSAIAVEANGKKETEVKGLIVSMDWDGRAFLLRQRRRDQDRFWVVRINASTKIEIDHDNDDDDDDRDDSRDKRIAFGHLRVGDMVEVEGRLLRDGEIMAKEIEVVGHVDLRVSPIFQIPSQPIQFPRPIGPFPTSPQIFAPPNGAEIATTEFTIVGRTFPEARVRIAIATLVGPFQVPGASAELIADRNGFFAHTVRPVLRIPGAIYRITVTSTVSGVVSPATVIVVRQV